MEHVNGDFRGLFPRIDELPYKTKVAQAKAYNRACVLAYAFYRLNEPIHISRFDNQFQN